MVFASVPLPWSGEVSKVDAMAKEMTVIGHLTELRKRLIVVLLTFLAFLALGFYFAPDILTWIKRTSNTAHIEWNVFGFTDGLMIYLKCAVLVAIFFTLPVLFYQTWKFVKPGLTEQEARNTFWYVPVSFFLFLIGASFSYYIVFPFMIQFMSSINQSLGASEVYGMDKYLTFLFNTVLPVSLIFELPLVILFLTRLGLITPRTLKRSRKKAYFVLVIIALMITPPDITSDLLVSVPLILLYEAGVLVSEWATRIEKRKGLQNVGLENQS